MEVDVSRRNMKQIEENVRETVKEFQMQDSCSTRFGEPVIVYLSTTHPLFDTFFARGENDHPKNIYRPGNTLILHYVPWEEEVARSNEPGEEPSQAWKDADRDSLWLAMAINKTIRNTLDKVGRIHSNTSSMVDWSKDKNRYGWSNKIAAFIGGIGEFGPAGSLHVPAAGGASSQDPSEEGLGRESGSGQEEDMTETVTAGYGGRVGSIVTAALYAEKADLMDADKLEEIFNRVMADCRFLGAGGAPCSEDMVQACPGGAISREGIDRAKCQAWCETIDAHTPAPEVCGKCFRFR